MRNALANFTRRACRGRRAGMVLACAAFVFTAVFVFSSGAAAAVAVQAQKKAAATAPVQAKSVPAARLAAAKKPVGIASAANGLNTGITVHGHWVINILTPEGKLVSHHEFENTLTTLDAFNGGDVLALLLSGNGSVDAGGWSVLLGSQGNRVFGGGGSACCVQMTTSLPPGTSPGGPPFNALGSPGLTLSGQATASTGASPGTVTAVSTELLLCAGSVAPSACSASASQGFTFTSAGIPTVTVSNLQIIQVTVTFSFS